MDTERICNLYSEEDTMRPLTKKEIDTICDGIKIPFPGVKAVIALINRQLDRTARVYLADVEMYGCFVPIYTDFVINTFLTTLIDPGTPIGPIASDAVGQQATQALLNTFHQAGSAKSGGPDGIRENISISKNRKTLYSVIHFKDNYLTLEDVMEMKREFIGVSIEDLAESILPVTIDIKQHLMLSDEDFPRSREEGNEMLNQGVFWWYPFMNVGGIYIEVPRTAIRIKLDPMRLFDFQITTLEIAERLKNYVFTITNSVGRSSVTERCKDEKVSFRVVILPSPTYLGILDVFLASDPPLPSNVDNDYFLQAAIASNEFRNIFMSGIVGIKNFYAVPRPVISIVRDVRIAYEYTDEGKEEIGTWVYFHDTRFVGVPVSRFVRLCKEASLEVDDSDIEHIDFHANKLLKENRSKVKISTFSLYGENENQSQYSVYDYRTKSIETYNVENRFFEIEERCEQTLESYVFLHHQKHRYNIVLDNPEVFSSKKELTSVIAEIMNGNENYYNALVKDEYFFFERDGELIEKPMISIPVHYIHPDGGIVENHIYISKLIKQEFTLNVNVDFINSVNNCTTLETAIATIFACREYAVPENLRIPKIKVLERVQPKERRLLIKSTCFFRNDFDTLNKDDEFEKTTPIDRLRTFLAKNVKNDKLKEYVFAETQGSSLLSLCSHHLIDSSRTYCNHFHETLLFGIEATRNLLAFDLISMVNREGYINVKHPLIITDTTTASGINPMTSEGVSSQGKGVLAAVTFDHSAKYIKRASLLGKGESVDSAAACIFIGKGVKLGSGYASVVFDEFSISLSSPFIHSKGIKMKEVDDDEVSVEEEIRTYQIITGKFPSVKWVLDKFVNKDIMYYIDNGIFKFKNYVSRKIETPRVPVFFKKYGKMFITVVV